MREYNWANSVKKYLEYSNDREIAVIGDDIFTVEIYKTVIALGYCVPYVISHSEEHFADLDVVIKNENEIDNEARTKTYFLFAGLTGHKEGYTFLVEKGFELQRDFSIMGIGGYTKLLDSIDSLLTLNRVDEDIVGFRKFSNSLDGGYRIVVLGNSTADPSTGNLKSWSEILFELFDRNNIDVTIYNGAITGYSSTQEYLKLNRDVLTLNPDLVISFSGYNDVIGNSTVDNFPYLHKYENKFYEFLKNHTRMAPDSMYVRNVNNVTHGLPTDKKDYQIWVDNMRKMNAVCTEFSIKFRAYLQPMVEYLSAEKTKEQKKIIDEFENITHCFTMAQDEIAFCEGALSIIKNYSYIKDLTGIFKGKYNMYYDTCHCTQHGNEVLAEAIYQDILENYISGEKNEKN